MDAAAGAAQSKQSTLSPSLPWLVPRVQFLATSQPEWKRGAHGTGRNPAAREEKTHADTDTETRSRARTQQYLFPVRF